MSSVGFPLIMTKDGPAPTPPLTLNSTLVARATELSPGLTTELPASLIEDMSSTCTGALIVVDQTRVDFVNSITPFGANEFLLNQLGQVAGVQKGVGSNTSIYVVFSGPAGFVVPKGFTVSDGSHQYVVQEGGVIASSGNSTQLFCVATVSGTWSVPVNTVTSLVTSAPSGVVLTVTNPSTGTPGAEAQSDASYRAQVLQAGLAVSQGMPTMLRTLLGNVAGVQNRLISINPGAQSGTWKILVGGGDPYEIAYAIFRALFDVSSLVGSSDPTRNITATVIDYPDQYEIPFVNPKAQDVSMIVSWTSNSTNIVSATAVAQLSSQALAEYINAIYAKQPINIIEMQSTFLASVESLLPASSITSLSFEVYIDGILTPPSAGTKTVYGDSEGYFTTSSSSISVVQG